MSEESNVVVLSTEKDENLENGIMKEDNVPKLALNSDESPFTENAEEPAEQVHVQENRQPIEPAESEKQNRPVLGCLKSNVEAADSSPSDQQLSKSDASSETKSLERTSDVNEPAVKSTTSDASTETKSLESTSDVNEPAVKSTTSDASTETKSLERTSDVDPSTVKSTTSSEISPSRAPSSDKGLEVVAENIQLIYEGLKDMKISTQEIPVSASGKKGRKPPTTPRARSTPVKPLTSPPLTRSRSRDLRKFPSTPSSPRSSASRKTSESDSDEMKGLRGRQMAKKN
ncbi:hypothetical protein AVEN_173921-1 [Araneus ventricosus]|uniref:Uncharacterized protein n=1 Tax=Araneus ventricosus TaxID=182803 RepID=A0A4Y2XAW1_ARAVE|nr:hypothetical protein AVEN_173921-1 [Araneus ventricosus]